MITIGVDKFKYLVIGVILAFILFIYFVLMLGREIQSGVSYVEEHGLKSIVMPIVEKVWEGNSDKKKVNK